jgi:hypothetical protein
MGLFKQIGVWGAPASALLKMAKCPDDYLSVSTVAHENENIMRIVHLPFLSSSEKGTLAVVPLECTILLAVPTNREETAHSYKLFK